MKVLLIWPWMDRIYSEKEIFIESYFPLGIGYLASYIRDEYDVSILDLAVQEPSPKKLANGLIRFGCSDEVAARLIKDINPDVVGISQMFSYLDSSIMRLTDIIKSVCPKAIIVLGGTHPTVDPETTLESNANVDYLILGEGEIPFKALLDHIRDNKEVSMLDAVGYRKNNKIHINRSRQWLEDIDDVPFPARDLVDCSKYTAINLVASRGCPCSCRFCSAPKFYLGKHRRRKVDRVVEEILTLTQNLGPTEIRFHDENLTFDMSSALKLFNAIAELKVDIKWMASATMSVSAMSFELLKAAKDSGLYHLSLAIESGSSEILKLSRKALTLNKANKVVQWAKQLGFEHIYGTLLVGLPGETRETVEQSIKFAQGLNLEHFNICIFQPVPGSSIYDQMVAQGHDIQNLKLSRYSSAEYSACSLSTDEINTLRDHMDYELNYRRNAIFYTDDTQRAINKFLFFSELHPDSAKIWYYLGIAYYRSGQPRLALEAFLSSQSIDKDFEYVSRWITLLNSLNDSDRYLSADSENSVGYVYPKPK